MVVKGSWYDMSDYQKEAIRQSRKGYKPNPITCFRISMRLRGLDEELARFDEALSASRDWLR